MKLHRIALQKVSDLSNGFSSKWRKDSGPNLSTKKWFENLFRKQTKWSNSKNLLDIKKGWSKSGKKSNCVKNTYFIQLLRHVQCAPVSFIISQTYWSIFFTLQKKRRNKQKQDCRWQWSFSDSFLKIIRIYTLFQIKSSFQPLSHQSLT